MITQRYSFGIAGKTPPGGNRATEATTAMVNILNDVVEKYTGITDTAKLVKSNDDNGSFAVRIVPIEFPPGGVDVSSGITDLMLNDVVSMVKSGLFYPASNYIVKAVVKIMIYDRFDERAQRKIK